MILDTRNLVRKNQDAMQLEMYGESTGENPCGRLVEIENSLVKLMPCNLIGIAHISMGFKYISCGI